MLDWIIVNVICPCLGTVAFAIMFNVPKRFYVSCGIIGTLGWLVYCAAVKPTSPSMASFFASLTVVLISRVLTVRMKCPITMFLIPVIFRLIPEKYLEGTTGEKGRQKDSCGLLFTRYQLSSNGRINLSVD